MEQLDYFEQAFKLAANGLSRILTHPNEAKILIWLMAGPRTYTEISEATGISEGALSKQLSKLKERNMILKGRVLKRSYYYDLTSRGRLVARNFMSMIYSLGKSGELNNIVGDDRGQFETVERILKEIGRIKNMRELRVKQTNNTRIHNHSPRLLTR